MILFEDIHIRKKLLDLVREACLSEDVQTKKKLLDL